MKLIKLAAILGSSLGFISISHADQLFSLDSSLTGWTLPASINSTPGTVTSNALTVTNQSVALDLNSSAFTISPSAGSYMAALNPTSTGRISDNGGSYDIDAALGLASHTFFNTLAISGDNDSKPTNAAVISRDVALTTGKSYTFYWAYAAQDYDPYKDGVFFSYSKGGIGALYILARNGSVTTPAVSSGSAGYPSGTIILPSYGSTAWNKFSFAVPGSGTYKVAFGAFNGGDTSVDPILFLADANGTILGDVFLTGPSAEDTNLSMQGNAYGTRKIYSLLGSYLNPGLSYDCSVFDKNGVCVAVSGRYSTTSGSGVPEATSGVIALAYKVNPNIRVGAFVEQYAERFSSGGVTVHTSNPDFGIFGVWSKTGTDEGLKIRGAYRYGTKKVTTTREAIGSAEPGSGNADLTSQGAQLTVSNGYRLNNTVIASPYVGIRYTSIVRNSYTESLSDTVTTPLSYDALKQEATSLLAGVSLSAQVAASVVLNGSLGVETDTSRKTSAYSASGIPDLASIQFNNDTRRTRAVASAGAAYKISNTQQFSGQVVYREEAFDKVATTTAMITYTAGF